MASGADIIEFIGADAVAITRDEMRESMRTHFPFMPYADGTAQLDEASRNDLRLRYTVRSMTIMQKYELLCELTTLNALSSADLIWAYITELENEPLIFAEADGPVPERWVLRGPQEFDDAGERDWPSVHLRNAAAKTRPDDRAFEMRMAELFESLG